MKLLNFKVHPKDQFKFGIKTDFGILDVAKAWKSAGKPSEIPTSLEQWLEGNKETKENFENFVASHKNNSDFVLQEKNIEFGPCVPKSAKIICVGLNYKKHAQESNMEMPKTPILFNKFGNALLGHMGKVEIPIDSNKVDFEAELGIVIGKKAKKVPKENSLDYVAGYCNVNDISARDLQFRTNQWLLGKSCDGFSPAGPYLVTPEEVGDPNKLKIETFLNGKVRQSSNTADMIFNCNEIISYISNYITLEPGDFILTGTPEGVILGLPENEQVWLTEGDEVTIKIEKLGELTSQFISSF
ncbi:MAG: fumarylacetoacetate hydrolase family protein [Bacilli bacterium]|nr:fumarylacetoacetate hydrolase family protein [Bacilli bacterium]